MVWGGSGVYVSINKGVSWTQLNTIGPNINPGLWANAAGDIFYAPQGAGIFRHSYRGLTANWSSANMTQVFSVAPSTVNSMTFDNSGKIYLSAFDKIYTSTNGTTFTIVVNLSRVDGVFRSEWFWILAVRMLCFESMAKRCR